MKFRKKPVVIEAEQFDGTEDSVVRILAMGNKKARAIQAVGNTLVINTLEGAMEAVPGDWIICGVQGELYPCKPDIFEATYERV